MTSERVSTGIEGLDLLLEGGFLRNRVILVQGDAGTGKTTLGLQFLVDGALNEEPGLLLSMEYEPGDIAIDVADFGWEIDKLQSDKKLGIVSPPGGFEQPDALDIDSLINFLYKNIDDLGARRLVIDSLDSLKISLSHSVDRRALLRFITLLRDLNCTTLLITEQSTVDAQMYSYMAHGIIQLYYFQQGSSRLRALEVLKMRGTNHSNLIHSMNVATGIGIEVLPHEVDLGI